MIKKSLLLTLLLALLVPWAAKAQSLFSEDFEGGSMPTGWTTDGSGTWSVGAGDYSASTGSGQGNYNAKITHNTTGNVTKLITPEIDLSSVTSAELSFMHIQRSWAGDIDELRVYYRTSSSGTWTMIAEYTSAISSWTTEEGIGLPNLSSTYQLAFEHTDNYGYGVGVDAIVIAQPASCAKPSGLAATLTPGDGTIATLDWTAGGTETNWVLEYGTASDFTGATSVNVSGTPTKNLTGLTPETTYYARVKADCGGGDQSDWCTDVCTFTPTDSYSITVNDGTSTNGYVPIYGYYVDDITKSQFIIPASELTAMAWGTINKMTFYASNASINWGNAQFEVYMTETSETTLSELADYSTMTKVKNAGSLSISDNQMVVELDTPYEYSGGNLMIGFLQTVTGSWSSCSWYGVSATGASMGGNGSSISQQNFLPKTTFEYLPGSAPTCLKPTDLAVSNITATSAILSWTENGTASEWVVAYSVNGVDFREVAATTNPFILTPLDDNTDYFVKVKADCGGGDESSWSSTVNFTTLEACPTPTNLAITDITAFTANIGWTSTNTNFDLRYTTDIDATNDFETSSLRGWTNIDADGDGYVWVLGSACGGIYLASGGSLAGSGHNDSNDLVTSGSFSNETSSALTPDNYLVSPQITLGGSISFWACAQDASYPAEHFGVAVSTTGNTDPADFTTIQAWDMSAKGRGPVLRVAKSGPRGGNRATGNWYQYTVDLSAYSGLGYVAIRHFGCTDQFLLNVDDIEVVQPGGFQVNWTDVPNPTNPQTLTNLNDETTYVVQVRSNCGGDGTSQWLEGMFTTLPSCMVPTNLAIDSIDKRSAILTWTSNGNETAWQVMLSNATDQNILDATDTTYTLTNLEPLTQYTVKVRAVCDATTQSNWSNPVTFTTLVACPAPTNLAVADITRNSAVVSWVSDGDIELEYAEDVWMHYDNDVFAGAVGMGTAGTRFAWGSMFPAAMLTSNNLTQVALYEIAGRNVNDITVIIYQGGETAPETQLYTETFAPMGATGWHEVTLATPVTIDLTQNLWVVFSGDDAYPAQGCADMGTVNNRWTSLDNGTTWGDLTSYGVSGRSWMIRAGFDNAQTRWTPVDNAATPQTITGLTPETKYYVRVRHICGGIDGESAYTTTMFTTAEGCPAPDALAATPYANSAVLSWNGESDNYTVSYRTAAITQGTPEEFGTSIPTGWTKYSTLLNDDVLNGTTALTTGGSWNFGTANGVFDAHARVNIYGTSCKYWLVTPAMDVTANNVFSFDLALTAYSGTVAAPATTGTDDRFVVLISTDDKATWTILRQWDNAGSSYVYNNIACSATGENVVFDFSAYAGQTVCVAFYAESTTSNADNNLHIDNVILGSEIPAGAWQTATTNETSLALTGLDAGTKYEFKVEGDCGSYGISDESQISSFTTTDDLCPVPTGLAVDTVTATTADLHWNGSLDVAGFNVRFRGTEYVVGGLSESFDANSVPSGWTKYTGLVDDVVAGTATLSTTTSGWITNSNALGTYNMKVNIYGTSVKYWLVTPEVTPTSGTFTFDLALTDYGNEDPIEDATAQDDDRFVVLVYANNAWTILREWNNTGSADVYNTIATTGENVSIDLSAYVGQTVKIAFYGESTVSGNGDNDLHIDNVVIGNPQTIPATDWQTVTTSDMSITLTGLTPETPYEAQVQSDCDTTNAWSSAVTFTTLEQTTFTQTIALTASSTNWISTYLDITLADLQTALVTALPGATNITIKTKVGTNNYSTTYNGSRWRGSFPATVFNVTLMYQVTVPSDCEIMLTGMPVNPADHPVTIAPGNNWIGFQLGTSMTPANTFAGFALSGDGLKTKVGTSNYSTTYNGTRWRGNLSNLEPGRGYIYQSTSTENRTFVFPTSK